MRIVSVRDGAKAELATSSEPHVDLMDTGHGERSGKPGVRANSEKSFSAKVSKIDELDNCDEQNQ